jgi:phosphoadenosine phosphosulfate reductase
MNFDVRIAAIDAKLASYRAKGLRMFASSSFQTNSAVLLHILSRVAADVPVYFMNTGYHFPETLSFRRDLAKSLGLDVRDLRTEMSRIQQRDAGGRLLFASDPDECCHLNKVVPLEPVLAANDIWISGVRASQSSTRAAFAEEQPSRNGVTRYHPILSWTSEEVRGYRLMHDLPAHPLDREGYVSVGCEPCTRRVDPGADLDNRSGRWVGLTKTECGLHL